MTLNQFKIYASNALDKICDNPDFEAEQLIQSALNINKSELLFKRNEILSEENAKTLQDFLKRRLSHEPLQYICNEWEFFGLRIFCGKGCLIPRPDTETLAELAIKMLPENGHLLDLCTGSGCITVAVLNNRTDVTAEAVDISKDALIYARKNIKYHLLKDRIAVKIADVSKYTPKIIPDVIVSNPPYIKSADIQNLEPEVKFEPILALDGGEDGLIFYRIIAERYKQFLKETSVILTEVGYDIADDVVKVFEDNGYEAYLVKDVFKVDRVCVAKIKKEN